MPVEFLLLKGEPVGIYWCPCCMASPFEPFLRGIIQRRRRTWYLRKRPYCALICGECKALVGWEMPPPCPPGLTIVYSTRNFFL